MVPAGAERGGVHILPNANTPVHQRLCPTDGHLLSVSSTSNNTQYSNHGHMDLWVHGHMGTWVHGNMDICVHGHMDGYMGYMGTWTHGYMSLFQCCLDCRTVYDLAKETDGIVKLEQETNTLNITFMMTDNPLVWLHSTA